MSKKDYRKNFEENRQSIEIEETKTRLSRSQRRKKKKSKETPLLTILTVILVGIPLAILIYVWGFWEPSDNEVAEKDEGLIEVQRNTVSASSDVEEVDEENKEDIDEEDKESSSKNEDKVATNKPTSKERNDDSSSNEKKSTNERNNSSANEEKKNQTTNNHSSSNQEGQQPSSNISNNLSQVHTVSENETLYRIASRYYSDPISGVDKIKAANNLSSDIINPGQSLIIPQ